MNINISHLALWLHLYLEDDLYLIYLVLSRLHIVLILEGLHYFYYNGIVKMACCKAEEMLEVLKTDVKV